VPPAPGTPHRDEPSWPLAEGARERVVFLVDASSRLERRLLLSWIERNRPEGTDATQWDALDIPPSRRRTRPVPLAKLEAMLSAPGDPLLAPLRVAWLPRKVDGVRAARLSDLLAGDPRDPNALRQRWIAQREFDRCRIVAGEPAPASELRQRWRHAMGGAIGETTGFAEFVARQAALALERAERRLRGARYKVPRFVREDILARPAFRGGVAQLARQTGKSESRVTREAAGYLKEIAATHSTFAIDLMARLIRRWYTQGYAQGLRYDPAKLDRVAALAQRQSVVFLPTHKSNLDHLVLQYMLFENGHPPNHTAGGINMNFFPLGQLARRSGVFFIRRSFKDNDVYKFVLRQYIDYLIEKRFALEWYIEGGRSRSGKLLPPRFGLLAYVVDAYRRGRADDVVLVPVSIAYDQISDVQDYAHEQLGGKKKRESFGWFVSFLRRLRRPYGAIHIDFGEPLSLAKSLGPPDPAANPDPDEHNLALQKLAFEVCVRINAVTPITPVSLVTLALLGTGGVAQTVPGVMLRLKNLLYDVARRDLPNTGLAELETDEGVERVLDALAANEVVDRFAEGSEVVYRIGAQRELAAAYYRNSVIHFFVEPAIAELALIEAGEAGERDDRVAAFWRAAMQLRDLLKFEFFFEDRDAFRGTLRRELAERDPNWEETLARSPEGAHELVRRSRPFNSHRVLRPFLEAYRVVADRLAGTAPGTVIDERGFLDACLGLGRQYYLQRRIHSAESVSKVLFESALKVADNRNLLHSTEPEVEKWRRVFAEQIRSSLRRIDAVEALAASRRAGLIE
jgi:glycerol-3-phosphate O-acyltransferase